MCMKILSVKSTTAGIKVDEIVISYHHNWHQQVVEKLGSLWPLLLTSRHF